MNEPKRGRGGSRRGAGRKAPLERCWQIEVGRRYEALLERARCRPDTSAISVVEDREYLEKAYHGFAQKAYHGFARKNVRMLKEGELSFEEITNFSPLKKISENLYGNPDAPLLLPTKRVRPVGQQRKLLDAVIADVEKDFKNFKGFKVTLTREQVRRYHKLYKAGQREAAKWEAILREDQAREDQ